ncbi:hypothetical protein [Rhodoflexus sp.]
MSKIITVYCEGKKGSPDYDVLEQVLMGLFAVKIEPIGSKRGAAAVIDALEGYKPDRSDYYFFFRDRDFDKNLQTDYQNSNLSTEAKKHNDCEVGCICFSRRTTIENYLIHPQRLFEFVQMKDIAGNYQVNNFADVQQALIAAAKDIRYYQAARHALGAMRTDPKFGTSWMSGSGSLPTLLDEQSCINEAEKLLQGVAQITTQWTVDNFRLLFSQFKDLFDDTFFNQQQFLIWFQGKDLAKALCKRWQAFPLNDYYKFAKAKFDYTEYDDLVTFRTMVESKL